MLELLLKLLTVLAVAVVELWAAVPMGLALGLNPVAVWIVTTLGAMLGVMAVVWLGEGVRAWVLRWRGGVKTVGRQGFVYRIWVRYGVVGLGLLGPLILGAPLAAAVGVTLGAPTWRFLFWLGIGVTFWCAAETLAIVLGLSGIQSLWH